MDISIEDAFRAVSKDTEDVLDTADAETVEQLVRALFMAKSNSMMPDWLVDVGSQIFAAGMVYQSQFTGKIAVEMDADLVSEFLRFLAGDRGE